MEFAHNLFEKYAPMNESVTHRLMDAERNRHQPNACWKIDGWMWSRWRFVLFAALGVAFAAYLLSVRLGAPFAVSIALGVAAPFVLIGIPWRLIDLCAVGQPDWWQGGGEIFQIKHYNNRISRELCEMKVEHDYVWFEALELRHQHGEPIAGVLWLVHGTPKGRKTYRGVQLKRRVGETFRNVRPDGSLAP